MITVKHPFLFIIFLLSACSSLVLTPPAVDISATPTIMPPTALLTATETSMPVSPTSTPPVITFREQCLDISTDISLLRGDNKDIGILVVTQDDSSDVLYSKLNSPYLYEVGTGLKTNVPGGSSFAVSLNREQLAYVTQDDLLIIADRSGDEIAKRPFTGISIFRWVKDGLIVWGENGQAFLNPITNERTELDDELPNIYSENFGWYYYWGPRIAYDPTLTRAVYPVIESKAGTWVEVKKNDVTGGSSLVYKPQPSETYISLWDVQSNKELLQVARSERFSFFPEAKPEWSSDGEQVIVAVMEHNSNKDDNDRKLISINKNGYIKTLMIMPDGLGVMRFSLSDDQRYLAFWTPDPTNDFQIENFSLNVFDLVTGVVTDYCIISPSISFQPIWSPDNRYLAVELSIDGENSEVVVVDIEKNIAVKIADNAMPVGWLK